MVKSSEVKLIKEMLEKELSFLKDGQKKINLRLDTIVQKVEENTKFRVQSKALIIFISSLVGIITSIALFFFDWVRRLV